MGILNGKVLSRLVKSFSLSTNNLKIIIKKFHSEMSKGLSGRGSSLAMIPTYVSMPSGKEKGRYIALDLGGTNFRILAVDLKGHGRINIIAEQKFKLERKTITGAGKQLFDFIARSIKCFIHANSAVLRGKMSLGFTFSFPLRQTSIADGILLFWNKEFCAKNVVGKNVVTLLNLALKREGIENIKITALVNDTVGTLAAKAYSDSKCDLGVILGTGTNACYPEKISDITKWRGKKTHTGHMVINMEWGNFNKLRRTRYDIKIDKDTSNPNRQRLEKMVSGMYLGEIARVIICDLIKGKKILNGATADIFYDPYKFKTEYISEIMGDKSKGATQTNNLLKKLGIVGTVDRDMRCIREISRIVVTRSAYISAAAMAAVILWMDIKMKKKHTIAIDGSLFEKCPTYHSLMINAFRQIFKDKAKKINLVLAKDGSGKGAAVIAAVAGRELKVA